MVFEKLRNPVKIKLDKEGNITRVTFKKKNPFMPVVREHMEALSAYNYSPATISMEMPQLPIMPKDELAKLKAKEDRMNLLLKEHGASAILSDLSSIPADDLKELDDALRSSEWEFRLSMLGHYVLERKK